MTLACMALFASISTHWVINITRLFEAFIYRAEAAGGPTAYYATLSEAKNVAKSVLYVFQCLLADSIMVFRVYHVWGRNWKITLFPLLTTVGLLITCAGICYQIAVSKPGVDPFSPECGRWVLGCFTLTLVTNIYSTSLIAYKLWSTTRPLQKLQICSHSRPQITRILYIVVESAFIYSAFTLATFVSYLVRSNVQFPGLDSTSPIVGLVFCLIIVRVHLIGLSIQNDTKLVEPNPSFQLRTLIIHVNQQASNHIESPMVAVPMKAVDDTVITQDEH
ncbi:hypothetical protein ONZ45_g6388 [Pleurotus djamor]|nr:hypothetical protein ONZ45_g6388 [Pleurotus djamor]